MSRLLTLGRLALEGSDFSEQKPLLLLACLAIDGRTVRGEIAERFWGGPDKDLKKVTRSLEMALLSLRKVDPGLIDIPGRGEIDTEVASDVHELHVAMAGGDYPRVMELYRGPFLNGIERNARIRLPEGGELEEWIINEREEIRGLVQEAMLRQAEAIARKEAFADAAELAWRGYRLDGAVTYPTIDEYRRIHTLLLAGGRSKEADTVQAEALEFGDADELHLCHAPQEARRRLTARATLPAPAEIFLGREPEVAAVLERVRTPGVQLVTLVGPPGVGKTELASAVAHEARRRGLFPRGLAFVTFDGVAGDVPAASLLERMAAGLHLWLSGGPPQPQDLAHALGDRETLLVLDNFELLAPQADLLSELIELCPALTLLVTSRVVLALKREHLMPTAGLPFPPEGATDPASYPAVQVFLAAADRRGAPLPDTDLPHIARIARLTEGLPLALHLAAGWSRNLSVVDIAERLGESFELLESGLRDVPERQRSLLTALRGSLALLTSGQRELFRRLSVFREGFTFEATERVANARVADLLTLNSRSLLHFDAAAKRHRLHPLIRRYAAELLADTDEAEAIRDAHARHYHRALQLMMDPDAGVRDTAPKRLQPDTANLVDAWRHAVRRGWRETVALSAHPLERLLDLSGRYQLGTRLLEEAGEILGASDDGLPAILDASRAWLLLRQGRYREAIDLADGALAGVRAIDGVAAFRGLRKALASLGASHDALGRFPEGRRFFEEAVAIEPLDDPYKAVTLMNLGQNTEKRGDLAGAEELYRQANGIFLSHGRRWGVMSTALTLGELYLRFGRLSEAEACARTGLELARELAMLHWEGQLQRLLGEILVARGHGHDAAPYAERAMEIARGLDVQESIFKAYLLQGVVAARGGDIEATWLLFREGWALACAIGFPRQVRLLQRLLEALASLGDEERVAAVAGYLGTVEGEPTLPSSLREAIRSLLAEHQRLRSLRSATWERGRSAGLDRLVGEHLPELLAEEHRV